MDSDEKARIDQEKMDENAVNHNSVHGWSNLSGMPMDLSGPCHSMMQSCREEFMGDGAYCSSAPMVDSFGRELWDQASDTSLGNLRHYEVSHSHDSSNPSETSGIRTNGNAAFRSDVSRNPQAPMLRSGPDAPSTLNMLPGTFCLPQFPTDSGFIERAAQFSCFNGGNFTSLPNLFAIPESSGCYPVGPDLMPGPMEIFHSNFVKSGSNLNARRTEDVDMACNQDTSHGCPQKNDRKRKGETVMRCRDEVEQGVGLSSNESDECDHSGSRSGQANTSIADSTGGEGSFKEVAFRKRRTNDVIEAGSDKANEALGITNNDDVRKVDQNPSSATSKGTGKNNKRGTLTSDPSKGDYIHVRARRGQATNSHSLAERVRREKISERMKLLQDIVPGCSKVTGKAVMLDEIINYVQSLQRQVEFLSMKLATVNPRLDCNSEGFHAKEMIPQRVGPSTLGITPAMQLAYPQVHVVHPGLVSPDVLGSATHGGPTVPLSAGLRETSQVPHSWDHELHNVVQLGFSSDGAAPISQDSGGSLPPDNMKVEL